MALIATCKDKDGRQFTIRIGNDDEQFVRDHLKQMNPSVTIISLAPEVFEGSAPSFADVKALADVEEARKKIDVKQRIADDLAAVLPAGAKIEHGG